MKTDIAEILKNKPKSTVLYDALRDKEVAYRHLTKYGISCYTVNDTDIPYSRYGTWPSAPDGLQILFPSKDMQDWEKFNWQKGDVLVYTDGAEPYYAIFEVFQGDEYTAFKSRYNFSGDNHWLQFNSQSSTNHFAKASNEEAKKFIKKIEEYYGGKLNIETLEIERSEPQFKNGDIVSFSNNYTKNDILIFEEVKDGCLISRISLRGNGKLLLCRYFDSINLEWSVKEGLFHLATEKEKQQLFDALAKKGKRWNPETKTLEDLSKKQHEFKPFDKVLVRDYDGRPWHIDLFERYRDNKEIPFKCMTTIYKQCIPYNNQTAHLLGTTDDWEGGEV